MATKMTLKDYFAEVRVLCEDAGRDDLVKFVDERVAQIEKKNASKGETKTQKANKEYTVMVTDILVNAAKPISVTDICKSLPAVPELPNGWSTQKVTSLLTPLVKSGEVNKTIVKGKSLYSIA